MGSFINKKTLITAGVGLIVGVILSEVIRSKIPTLNNMVVKPKAKV